MSAANLINNQLHSTFTNASVIRPSKVGHGRGRFKSDALRIGCQADYYGVDIGIVAMSETWCNGLWELLRMEAISISHQCCGQLWVWHIVCGQTCDGLYHFVFYLINFGIPLGSHTIKPALARHTGVQVPVVPAKVITWSFLTNHKARSVWALVYRGNHFCLPYPTYGYTWVVLWLLFFRSAPSTFPDTWSTFKGPFRGVPSR